jgi:hypothetical protein
VPKTRQGTASTGARPPRIVAELGRPETPEETAARKAENSRNHRANQTALNLVIALVASLVVVLVIVLVVVRPDPPAREPVDYTGAAAQAQPGVDDALASPALPPGWSANAARLEQGADDVTSWYVGFITPHDQFIAMRQGVDANATWLSAQLENGRPTGTTVIDGVAWQVYDQRDSSDAPGNLAYALSTAVGDSTIVLFGTADDAEFEALATSITADITARGGSDD